RAYVYPICSTISTENYAYWDKPVNTFNGCFATNPFNNNSFIATPANFPASTWTSGNFYPGSATAVQFVNYNNGNGGDYHLLPSSPYKGAGTDGKDLGADIDALLSNTAGVY